MCLSSVAASSFPFVLRLTFVPLSIFINGKQDHESKWSVPEVASGLSNCSGARDFTSVQF